MRTYNVYGFLLTCTCLLLILTIIPMSGGSSERVQRSVRSVVETKNNIKYGVICDAGSSGTRLFVYTLKPLSGGLTNIDTLIHESEPVVKKVTPGLSSFGDKPEQVVEYLTPLLRFAEEHIPYEQLGETDLLIFATAGMRLLPEAQKDAIIKNLQNGLKSVTALRVSDSNIRIIDGAWEGIYSWIAVNYILGRFDKENDSKVGMIDMGGASVQIAFEIANEKESYNGGNVYEINLGSIETNEDYKYKIYSTTFLGYGANEGLKKYENSLVKSGNSNDSCSPRGLNRLIGEFTVNGTGEWDVCLAQVSSLIGDKAQPSCPNPTCFLRNVIAPSVNLSTVQLYGFSEYWYTTSNFGSGGEYHYQKFTDEVRKYCQKDWNDIQDGFKRNEFPNADIERLGTNCFKAAWVTSVLHDGFNVDKTKHLFQSVLKIAGEEMQWALGAMLYHSKDLKFNLLEQLEVAQSTQQISNFFSFFVILIIVLAVALYRQLQSESTYKKYNFLRTDSKPDFLNV
ncbi:Nucleoside-triphosphatase ntp-1 [Caenorhabditis elegans]|nr:Nucleoside-triphosphatase ntp-1 [Caenorhabditis elegans]CDM63521.1 Nucleoside-triphosphatase ntp-1 [Caenorhabditis elegans]|eukprot:NP_001294166.1 Nucleoside-triphosphatase ntp-1 [Caenorhabditis elegans]